MSMYIKNSTKEQRVNMAISAELFQALTERAKTLKVSRAELIRFYCERGLEQGQEKQPTAAGVLDHD